MTKHGTSNGFDRSHELSDFCYIGIFKNCRPLLRRFPHPGHVVNTDKLLHTSNNSFCLSLVHYHRPSNTSESKQWVTQHLPWFSELAEQVLATHFRLLSGTLQTYLTARQWLMRREFPYVIMVSVILFILDLFSDDFGSSD